LSFLGSTFRRSVSLTVVRVDDLDEGAVTGGAAAAGGGS